MSGALGGGGLSIKSIQRGFITISSGSPNGTLAINPVVLSKSLLFHLGQKNASTQQGLGTLLLFVDASTVMAQMVTAPGNTVTVAFEVVEFN